MNIENLRDHCLTLPGTSESFPFDESTLVFKVMNKIYALVNLDGDLSINLKCDPEKAIDLRELYAFIVPGYHMNKKHWNTVHIDETVPGILIKELINHSYQLVVKGLSRKDKENLQEIAQNGKN
ncbi:MmcQ/YjbR family DNA-binding protein [Roseimarinus sediminis]|uniref:MmcQ/YjbR family DNA-binding protein n=1 Tax=Roseimarinus sediminis TaxID=1610899 RepID=UPI003D19B71D